MKTRLITILCFLVTHFMFTQIRFYHVIDQKKIENDYGFVLQKVVTTSPTPAVPYETKTVTDVSLCDTKRKGVISVSGGQIYLDLWQIKDGITCVNALDQATSLKSTQIRFTDGRSTLGNPTKVMWVPYRAINLGANTLPFRYRFLVKLSDGTIVPGIGTSSFQLALNLGYTWGVSAITTRQINNYSVTAGVYVGPSTTDLKKGVYKDPTQYVADQTNATMTYGFNLIFARNSLGLVLAFGTEKAMGKNANQWIYNGKGYFAVGINTSFGK